MIIMFIDTMMNIISFIMPLFLFIVSYHIIMSKIVVPWILLMMSSKPKYKNDIDIKVIMNNEKNQEQVEEQSKLLLFFCQYIKVYWLAIFVDYLQGPFVWLYQTNSNHYRSNYNVKHNKTYDMMMNETTSGMIYIMIGTIIYGVIVVQYINRYQNNNSYLPNHQRNRIVSFYCLIYFLASWCKFWDSTLWVIISQILIGISNTLLYSIFDAWLVLSILGNDYHRYNRGDIIPNVDMKDVPNTHNDKNNKILPITTKTIKMISKSYCIIQYGTSLIAIFARYCIDEGDHVGRRVLTFVLKHVFKISYDDIVLLIPTLSCDPFYLSFISLLLCTIYAYTCWNDNNNDDTLMVTKIKRITKDDKSHHKSNNNRRKNYISLLSTLKYLFGSLLDILSFRRHENRRPRNQHHNDDNIIDLILFSIVYILFEGLTFLFIFYDSFGSFSICMGSRIIGSLIYQYFILSKCNMNNINLILARVLTISTISSIMITITYIYSDNSKMFILIIVNVLIYPSFILLQISIGIYYPIIGTIKAMIITTRQQQQTELSSYHHHIMSIPIYYTFCRIMIHMIGLLCLYFSSTYTNLPILYSMNAIIMIMITIIQYYRCYKQQQKLIQPHQQQQQQQKSKNDLV